MMDITKPNSWHVTLDGKGILIVQKQTLYEAIEQVKAATGLDGEWSGHLWPQHCKCKVDEVTHS